MQNEASFLLAKKYPEYVNLKVKKWAELDGKEVYNPVINWRKLKKLYT